MSERTCRDVRADLSAYLDGDLDAGLTNETRVHLESCAACHSELELLRLTVGALHRLPELPPPAAILSGVRARLRPEPWHRRLFGGGLRHFEFPLGAAATLLVVLGVSLFVARYPDMPKEASQNSSPQSPAPSAPPMPSSPPAPPASPAPRLRVGPAPIARPAPAGRGAVAERQAPPDTTAPSRQDLRAKGALDSAMPQQDAYRGGEAASPGSSAAGAGARDLERAAPTEPAATTGLTAAESKVDQSRPEPAVAALKDALREESTRESDPQVESFSKRSSASLEGLDDVAGMNFPAAKKTESRAAAVRKADSDPVLGYARLAQEKEKAATGIGIACLLLPNGDGIDDLELLLRREGALGIEVSALEPPALREAAARHRGRLGNQPAPSTGWTVTARIQAPALADLLEALAGRPGLRVLERPAAPAAPGDPAEPLGLSITVFQ